MRIEKAAIGSAGWYTFLNNEPFPFGTKKMEFDGFIVGDWNGHGQVTGCEDNNCPKAFNAGVDIFMVPTEWEPLYWNTLEQVRSGAIDIKRLDDAVLRILNVKKHLGLFD